MESVKSCSFKNAVSLIAVQFRKIVLVSAHQILSLVLLFFASGTFKSFLPGSFVREGVALA